MAKLATDNLPNMVVVRRVLKVPTILFKGDNFLKNLQVQPSIYWQNPTDVLIWVFLPSS